MRLVLLVGLGGLAGSCVRYGAAIAAARLAGGPTFLATAFVNVTGCFVIGLLAARPLSPELRAFAVTGALGGYTTFSAFGLETFVLLEQGRGVLAAANAAGQVLVGLLAVLAGASIGRSFPS